MSSEPMRVASVGLGRWSKVIGAAATRSDKLEIVACFSRSQEKRDAFARQFDCDQAASYEELLADDRIEGVLLTTPNEVHAETVEQAARIGKHIWLEKPIANTMSDALQIREILEKTGVTFSVGHCARMSGASRKMKELIDTNKIGKLSMIEAHWSTGRAMQLTPDDWRWYADATPGGPLIQLLIHHFDTIQYLFGPVAEVQAFKGSLNTPAEVDDVTAVIVQFKSGYLGYCGSSWVSPGVYWVNIYGTETNLYQMLDLAHWGDPNIDKYTTLMCQPRGSGEKVPVEIPVRDMFREELEDFVDAVRQQRAPEIGWKEAAQALACVEAAIRSSNNKRPVTIAEVMH